MKLFRKISALCLAMFYMVSPAIAVGCGPDCGCGTTSGAGQDCCCASGSLFLSYGDVFSGSEGSCCKTELTIPALCCHGAEQIQNESSGADCCPGIENPFPDQYTSGQTEHPADCECGDCRSGIEIIPAVQVHNAVSFELVARCCLVPDDNYSIDISLPAEAGLIGFEPPPDRRILPVEVISRRGPPCLG